MPEIDELSIWQWGDLFWPSGLCLGSVASRFAAKLCQQLGKSKFKSSALSWLEVRVPDRTDSIRNAMLKLVAQIAIWTEQK